MVQRLAGAHPGVGAVRVVRVLPGAQAVCRAHRGGVPSPKAQEGPREPAATHRHTTERAGAGPAGQPQQHLLGLVVLGVPEQHQRRAEPLRGGLQRGVARCAGRGLGTAPRQARHGPRGRRPGPGQGSGIPPPRCRRHRRSRAAGRGRRRGRRPARRGARPRRRAPRPARASRPPAAARPGQESAARGRPGAPGRPAGSRRRPGAARPSAVDARTQSAGSAISAAEGSVSGEVQTALNPSTPTLSTTARTNTAPSPY